jgi:hypothetical protein
LTEVFGIKALYLVMDGKRCPLKADETQDREEKRRQNLVEARKFKRLGQRDKSEDKYKACIRIRDEFTRAVMKAVEEQFSGHNCVFIVWSPYEADAQLTKLCIDHVADAVVTEDSDVLVYSAAAHIVFPVLFKLDRSSGACDMISMDWLLSSTCAEAAKAVSTNNTLEVILRRFAARQSKRPGFGVRLFVQSCVLAGSDYSINMLDGIGLIGAFKLVRDNAHRNDNVRFRKILEALPSKTKQKVSIDDYEERLAKSEAVFYYHYVKHTDGNVKPLIEPRLSHEENGDNHHFTDHFPCLSRWGDEWSFLGKSSFSCPLDPRSNMGFSLGIPSISVSNIPTVKHMTEKTRQPYPSQSVASTLVPKMVECNPYKKLKTLDSRRPPLQEKSNSKKNEKEDYAYGPTARDAVVDDVNKNHPARRKSNDFMKYLKSDTDPRYVKRNFPPVASTKITPKYGRLRGPPSFFQLGHASGVRVTLQGNKTDKHASNDSSVPFEYDTGCGGDDCDNDYDNAVSSAHPIADENGEFPLNSEGNSMKKFHRESQRMDSDLRIPSTTRYSSPHFNEKCLPKCNATKHLDVVKDQPEKLDEQLPSFCDLIEINSLDRCETDSRKHRPGIEESTRHFSRVDMFAKDTTNPMQNAQAYNAHYGSMLEESPPNNVNAGGSFGAKRVDPRRVTLESLHSHRSSISGCQLLDPKAQLCATAKKESIDTPSKAWALDECIDSPGMESGKPLFTGVSSFGKSVSNESSTGAKASSTSCCVTRKAGPLDLAFQRQRQFSSLLQSQTIPTAQSCRYVARKRRSVTNLSAYFERVRSKEQTCLSTKPTIESVRTVDNVFVDGISREMPFPKPFAKRNSLVPQLQIHSSQTLDDFLWVDP